MYYDPTGHEHEANHNNSSRALEDEVLGRRDYGDSDFAERYSNHRATEDYFAKKEAQKQQQGKGGTDGGSDNGKKSNSGKTNGGAGNGSDKPDASEKKPKASNDGTDSSNNKPKADVPDNKPSQGGIIPDKARDIAKQVKANNGAPPKGYKGGRKYKNIPLEDGAQKLPEGVNYREYDINPYVKGQNRGAERIVIGDDGSVWYTNDHYYTFTRIE